MIKLLSLFLISIALLGYVVPTHINKVKGGVSYILPPVSVSYFVDNTSGNDANPGTNILPWKSIDKVNAMLLAGDNVYFKRGEKFYGTLRVKNNNHIISSYGVATEQPIFTGYTDITSMTSEGSDIYSTVISAATSTLNIVTINNEMQTIARYPNVTDANEGYLKYTTAYDSNAFRGAITGINYTGTEIAVMPETYRLFTGTVTSHKHDSIVYNRSVAMMDGGSTVRNPFVSNAGGRGYFFRKRLDFIDQNGEYYLNPTTKKLSIKIVGGLAGRTLRVATLDTSVAMLSGISNVVVNDIKVEGYNLLGVRELSCKNIDIIGCTIFATSRAISAFGCQGISIIGNRIDNSLEGAIHCKASTNDSLTITYNYITRTGLIKGQGSFYNEDYTAVVANVRSRLLVAHNSIISTGHSGITWVCPNHALIEKNYIDTFSKIMSDDGGLYGWINGFLNNGNRDTLTTYSDRVLQDNLIGNGIGSVGGNLNSIVRLSSGLYLDGAAVNDTVRNNTVWNVPRWGLEVNHGRGIVVYGNKFYNCISASMIFTKLYPDYPSVKVYNNLSYRFESSYADNKRFHLYFTDDYLTALTNAAMQDHIKIVFKTLNNNYYNKTSITNFKLDGKAKPSLVNGSFTFNNLAGWKTYSSRDSASLALPDFDSRDSARLIINTSSSSIEYTITWKTKDELGNIYNEGKYILEPWKSAFRYFYAPADTPLPDPEPIGEGRLRGRFRN